MSTKTDVDAIKLVAKTAKDEESFFIDPNKLDYGYMLSTGSTLLDLACTGGRVRGGGMPGGIIVEIFGPSGLGKTQILSEIIASAQVRGGDIRLLDPEARFKLHYYEQMYGQAFPKDCYFKPDTVSEMFGLVNDWKKKAKKGVINLIAADSLAALSTILEMDKGDKMGMRRAKEFSEGLRKTARLLSETNKILVATNQIRSGDYGDITPGGKAFPFYASLRFSMRKAPEWKIEVTKDINVGEVDKKKTMVRQTGVKTLVKIVKNSIDHPFREVPVTIMFDYGIDDIADMLQYVKDITGDTMYKAGDKKYKVMTLARTYIEKEDLQDKLREEVIDLWIEVESKFRSKRPKKKVR